MSTTRYLISLVFVCACLTRCTFAPHEEFVSPIREPEPLNLTIEVNDPNFADPYYLIQPTTFTFTLKELTKPIVDFEVLMGNQVVTGGAGDGNKISFHFFPHAFTDGLHKVTLRIRIATQSGSLADRLGGEYYLIEQSFNMVLDRTPPSLNGAPITAGYENGYLTVKWPASAKKNFFYELKRVYQPYQPLSDSVIRNTAQQNFVDKGYVGGDITYTLTATGYGFEEYVLGSVRFNDSPIDYHLSVNEARQVRLQWTSSKINTDNATVKLWVPNRELKIPLSGSNDLVIDTLGLGEEYNYFLFTSRNNAPAQTYQQILRMKPPVQLKEFRSYGILHDKKKLIIATEKTIYRYSLPELSLEDSLTSNECGAGNFFGMVVSADGARAVVVIQDRSNIMGFDPMNFDDRIWPSILGASRIFAQPQDPIYNIDLGGLSNNGLLTMILNRNGRRGVVLDINTHLIEWYSERFIYLNDMFPPAISNDGTRLAYDEPAATKGHYYEWENGKFHQRGAVATGLKFFRETGPELINTSYIQAYQTPASPLISIYAVSNIAGDTTRTLSTTRTFALPGMINGNTYLWEMKYDRAGDRLYSRYMRDATSIINYYDVNTFTFQGKAEAMSYTVYGHSLSGDYHVTNRGYIEPIK